MTGLLLLIGFFGVMGWGLWFLLRPAPDWQDEMQATLKAWEASDVKKRLAALQARHAHELRLSDAIGRQIGCVTRAGMVLDGGRWQVHTCCHGWTEVSSILQGKPKRPAWA